MVAVATKTRWYFSTKCVIIVIIILGLLGAAFGIAFALTSRPSQEPVNTGPTWCPWGGWVNNPGYDWAVPRDKERNEWYCDWVQEQATVLRNAADDGSGHQLILYGDSLTQCLRNWGKICEGATDWFGSNWGKYSHINLALGVENTDTVMWRLLNGHSPAGQNARLIFLMIGSNNFPANSDMDALKEQVAQRIIAVAQFIADAAPESHVMLMGLLPKTAFSNGKPSMMQSDAIRNANAYVNSALESNFRDSRNVHYAYCGQPFLEADGMSINTSLMVDGLHPNGQGWAYIGACLQPFFDKYMTAT